MIEHIKKFFLAIVLISCFTCFQRADYNLPLFTFAYFLWDLKSTNVGHPVTQNQKSRLFYLFVATWVVDFIWLIYWGVTWSSAEYKQNGSSGASGFVLTLSVISFIVKVPNSSLSSSPSSWPDPRGQGDADATTESARH